MPLAASLATPIFVRMVGNMDATTAPTPIKNDCVAKPVVCCSAGSMSPTKARKGSMLILMLASIIQSIPPAIQSAGELGIMSMASDAMMAPTRKNGRRRPQRGLQVRSDR